MLTWRVSSSLLLVMVACGPTPGATGDDTSTGVQTDASGTASGETPRPMTTMVDDSGPSLGTDTTAAATGDSSSGADACGDDREPALECESWLQDCCPGQKCVPHADDGGPVWNAVRCVEIDRDPQSVGEACTAPMGGTAGFDDCDGGSMCWGVDPRTNEGECVALCTGTPKDPQCDDGTACVITNDGALHLCLQSCDPLDPQCDEGEGCFPVGEEHVCAPDPGGGIGPGDSCEDIAVCPPGLSCISGGAYPGCEAAGCCSPDCDPTTPEGQAVCDALDPSLDCIPWFRPGEGPEDQGVCALPGA
ncbi:MAG: hypothetical protein AAF799_10790 [Myxococcota bacterium]